MGKQKTPPAFQRVGFKIPVVYVMKILIPNRR